MFEVATIICVVWCLLGFVYLMNSGHEYDNMYLELLRGCFIMGPIGSIILIIGVFVLGTKLIDWSFKNIVSNVGGE